MNIFTYGRSLYKKPIEHPDFNTHLNYIQFIERETKSLVLTFSNSCVKSMGSESSKLLKKKKIVSITLANIQSELQSVLSAPDYAEVCCAWIPVKAYYLLFHTTLILFHLIQCDVSVLGATHDGSRKILRSYLRDRSLVFNNVILNEIIEYLVAEAWTLPSGAHLKTVHANPEEMKKFIIRKLFEYKKEELKRNRGIKKLTQKILTASGFPKMEMCLFEFFYFYRIKVNYRDLEFMKDGLSSEDYKNFYQSYVQVTLNFYNAFKECINQLALIRFGKEILD